MTVHKRRTAPIRQTTSTILGGTALTFAMLLGFVNPSWALQVIPSTLTFSTTSGGTDPSPQTVVLSNNRSRERTWVATVNAPWITITPSSGTITTENDTVSVRTTVAGLAAGSYSASVTITETSQSGKIRRTFLPVTLSITGTASTPALQLSLSNLAFSGTAGGANPAPKTFSISNTGGGTLAWTANDTATWLTLSPAAGTNTGTVTASIASSGLTAGTYSATVTVSAPGVTAKTISVTLTITQSTSTSGFNVSPASLAYTGTEGGPNQPGSVTVTNTGTTALTVTWADSINWLVAIQPGVTQTIQPGQSGAFTITASSAGLTASTYSGTATITGGGTTKQIPITMTVTSGSATPAIGLSPTSLAFSGMAGGANPTAKTIGVSNTGGGTLTWTSSDNATWLTLTPVSGTNAGTMTASVNTAGLAAGTYNATVTISATGATAKTVPVTLTATAAGTGSATLTWNANTEPDLTGYKIYVGTQSGVYAPPITVGKVTSYLATNLTGGTTYFFSVTAYDSAGNESSHSPEVSKSIF